MQDVLLTAQDLKLRSRTARNAGRLQDAAELLTRAVDALELELSKVHRATANKEPGVPVSQEARQIAVELADCLGSLGGIRRRQGDIAEALKRYGRGKDLEQDDRYRMANSYNLVQSLVLPILGKPSSLKDAETRAQIEGAIETLRRQIATTRREDAWALSDLGLLKALLGDERGALQAWSEMDSLNPVGNVYSSGKPVLESLAEKLPDNAALQHGVQRFTAAIPAR